MKAFLLLFCLNLAWIGDTMADSFKQSARVVARFDYVELTLASP